MAERAQQITSIFHSAIAREPHERGPYLDGACGSDDALRHEVEELIRSHENAGAFIESPAYVRGAELLEVEVPRTRAGQSIGPYKIISLIGAGGMGEVYRANDARLGREVALKLLPNSPAAGTDSVRRFQQEARAASALNHPNILAIYDIGEHDGSPYIVSELLAGETLREKLSGVALATRKGLDYALQAARGLAAAHEKGIVHRDLKPENLFVTKDGRVKILDFGIAKLVERKTGGLHTEAPTLLVKTDPGMVIGTAGYMSPEQVRGSAVDHRSDIFSFGAIFYEMLSGKRAFRGESMVETLNAILKEEPLELSTANSHVAPEIARVVRRCLEKQPEERFQSASDLAFAIESLSGAQTSGSTNAVTAVTTSAQIVRRGLRDRLGWIVAAVFLVSTIALVALYSRRAEPPLEIVRFILPAPEKFSYRGELALSPDGRRLAFVVEGAAGRSLWVRALDSVEARELPGTGEAALPFWSPDSRFIAFFASNKLKRIDPVSGGPQVLADVSADARGGAWAPDGTIIFTPTYTTPLSKVSAEGGAVTRLTELDQSQEQISHRLPWFLPDGRHFFYFVLSNKKELQGIYVGSLDSKEVKFLLRASSFGAYAPGSSTNSGHLFFMRDKRLMAHPFDARRLELKGEPMEVAEGVLHFPEEGGVTAYAAFSVSANGHLSYIPGSVSLVQMGWFDREGKPLGLVGSPGLLGDSWLSPDGKRFAFSRAEFGQWDIWLLDLARSTTTRFTFDAGVDVCPVWSGDGNRIFFASSRDGGNRFTLYQKISSGAGSDELLLKTDYSAYPDDWFSGKAGELLLYEVDSSNTKFDLWVLPLTGERKPYPILQTQFNETHAQFSPDGRFVAYVSDESGRAEVYVQNFPASGGKWQISTGGGDQPQWRRDGRELFYMAPDKKLMVVPIVPGDSFVPGSPVALFATHVSSGSLTGNRNHYLVAPDGKRFLVSSLLNERNTQPITIVLNWAAALKQ